MVFLCQFVWSGMERNLCFKWLQKRMIFSRSIIHAFTTSIYHIHATLSTKIFNRGSFCRIGFLFFVSTCQTKKTNISVGEEWTFKAEISAAKKTQFFVVFCPYPTLGCQDIWQERRKRKRTLFQPLLFSVRCNIFLRNVFPVIVRLVTFVWAFTLQPLFSLHCRKIR